MSERIALLRETIDGLNAAGVRQTYFYSLAYHSLRQTRGESIQIRRAKAQVYILDHAPLAVLPHELIVGSLAAFCPVMKDEMSASQMLDQARYVLDSYIEQGGRARDQSVPGIPTFEQEFSGKQSRWALMSRVHHDANISYSDLQNLIAQMKTEYESLAPYEIGRELERAFKQDYGDAKRELDTLPWFAANHLSLDYGRVLDVGLRGLEAEVKRGLADADPEKIEYYQSAYMVLQAAQRFILRYANAVSGAANRSRINDPKEAQSSRAEELSRIAFALRRIAIEPANSFYEGVQLTWMLHIMMSMLGGSALSFGRFDQYLGARYEQDIANASITKEEAYELLCCLWHKINEPKLRTVQSMTLGGVTRDGNDAANELTRLCLDVVRDMKLPYPNVGVRINRQNEPWLLDAVIESICRGAGQPMIMNDDIWIENLVRLGHRLPDANDYYNMGCVEIMVPNKMPNWGVTDPIAFPMLIGRVLDRFVQGELALGSFDQFMEGFKAEMRMAVQRDYLEAQGKIKRIPNACYDPFASLMIDGCLEMGRDMFQNGSELGTHWSIYAYGLGTAADSLMAVKKWVYDQKTVSLEQLNQALSDDFQGREQLRNMLSGAPHYGNDLDEVDAIARSVMRCFNDAVFALNTPGARDKFVSTLFGYFFHIYHGEITAATPNGRRAGEPFSDSMGPSQGMDTSGPTAMLNSALKLDQSMLTGGYALNMKLSPTITQDEQGKSALRALISAYLMDGGPQIQFNFVDAEQLRDARIHPERHGDLIVRIGGYCEYFVNLDASLQQEIIQRTVHG
ncbi:pyruvate formate lyase [Eubacteriales bacterium OttesenSCG-928-N13]|nr:pyruvate formate lyase [Eubacteriales bacterium OttesenSCG-928-N13]